jgi:hypothetical protein
MIAVLGQAFWVARPRTPRRDEVAQRSIARQNEVGRRGRGIKSPFLIRIVAARGRTQTA